MPSQTAMDKPRNQEEEDDIDNRRRRYKPVTHIYSSTTPCVNASGSSNVMSKKVKARKIMAVEVENNEEGVGKDSCKANPRILPRPPILQVYRRKKKIPPHFRRKDEQQPPSLVHNLSGPICNGMREVEVEEVEDDLCIFRGATRNANHPKRKRTLKNELIGLGGSGAAAAGPRLRRTADTRNASPTTNIQKGASAGLGKSKKWVQLSFDDADPLAFVGLQCKVFWPMDDDWYLGTVKGYNSETLQHQVQYNDGDAENLILSDERIKFFLCSMEMHHLNLKCNASDIEKKTSNYDEMLALAVSYDDCQDFEAGDIVWAKLSGYAMWPALVISETCIGALGILKPYQRQRTVSVQFFGTHDFARINIKQVNSFFRGLLSSFHLKCKNSRFERSLEEAKMYLSQQQLPSRMIEMQNSSGDKDCNGVCQGEEIDNEDISSGEEESHNRVALLDAVPFRIGDLCVTNLGKVVFDSEYFRNKHVVWPDGYTATRKFMSISNPNQSTSYKMEVLRNPKSKERPLFRITLDDGEKIERPNPTVCWREIYNRIQRNNSFHPAMNVKLQKSGSYMFGFSVPKISQLIQAMPYSALSSKKVDNSCIPFGYRAVRVEWTDIDKCNVCHMDEEYDDNLFLQCDKCRMTVHARCYGEVGPLDGFLWFCNFCRSGGPKSPPPCCLCPVIGGAMKPTTDGRWAHLTCAMWIPETCLLDIQRMEPIDGVNRINKDRWKLLCNICGVPYGACIQCSYSNCYASYHPLCARAAGLCVELENEDQLYLQSVDDNDDGCIRLLSFCKKHRQTSDDRLNTEEQSTEKPLQECSTFYPRSNSSGCSRTEPFMFSGRRGQKEPQELVSASTKRSFIENTPYLVSGCCQNDIASRQSCGSTAQSKLPSTVLKLKRCQYGNPHCISSMGEKYQYMKKTYKKRLAFGKSQIHGFGVFAKIEHKAGDMVIEYVGELVRPPIADIREHRIYNSLVGAGTYMFRIDNERVVDATKAGSIAHLINHSCEPNCYSRMITVHGDEHIIIFAKRDICKWEELTYDYRFFSRDEQLSCFCGSSKCRGVVNDIEVQEQITNLWVPRSELIPWQEE